MALTGTIIFASGRTADFDIWSLNLATGKLSQLTQGSDYNHSPQGSPDGKSIVYVCSQDDMIPSIWVMDIDGNNKRRLTTNAYCQYPTWSPDGTKILFTSNASSPNEIEVCEIPVSGGKAVPIFKREGVETHPSYSPDSESILFASDTPDKIKNSEIFEFSLRTKSVKQLTSHPLKDYHPKFSPDGNKIAFISHRNDASAAEIARLAGAISEQVAAGDSRALNDSIRAMQSLQADGDVWTMNRDGSELKQITNDSEADNHISWSPCGNYLVYTSSSVRSLGSARLKIIDSRTGADIAFEYDRTPLESELGTHTTFNRIFAQKLIPDFIERKFADRSFWGREREPHWVK